MKTGPKPTPIKIRFERYIERITESGCWLWVGAVNNMGYGVMGLQIGQPTLRRTKNIYAHRLSWELGHGQIPAGLFVLHKCDVPCCVNPAHLFLGDQKDNLADAATKGRSCRGERNGTAKLTEEEVRQIRTMATSTSHSSLAAAFGVSRRLIGVIVQRKLWKHIPGAGNAQGTGKVCAKTAVCGEGWKP